MASPDELRSAFSVYYREMDRCEQAEAYWALLHLTLVLPDICATLEFGNDAPVGQRYTKWCQDNFPGNSLLTPIDRYQIRNAVLHEGSTLPNTKSQYGSVSFIEPGATDAEVHQHVSADGGDIVIDVKKLSEETCRAMQHWFDALQHAPERMTQVEANLHRLARVQPRTSHEDILTSDGNQILTTKGQVIQIEVRYNATSST